MWKDRQRFPTLMGGKPGKFHDARPEVDGERRFAQHRITQDARDLDTLELTDGPQIHGERSVFHEGQPAHAECQGSGAKCAGERPHLAIFYRCRNLLVRDVFLTRSAYHCVRLAECRYVRLDGVRIHNGVEVLIGAPSPAVFQVFE